MFVSKEGQNVPQVTFPTRQGDTWVNVTSDDLFKGKPDRIQFAWSVYTDLFF